MLCVKDMHFFVHACYSLSSHIIIQDTNGYIWQSRVEIEHYSVVYFAHIAAFEALYCRTSVKGGAHTHWVNVASIDEFTQCV